jgi:hypothetical protein
VLKEEPEDLTHLAPVAGDVDIPLEGSPFLEDDVFNDFMMSNYCPLDLMQAEDEVSASNCSPRDPFLTYRSDSSNSSSDHKLSCSPLPVSFFLSTHQKQDFKTNGVCAVAESGQGQSTVVVQSEL